jgi:hypothetical protein
MRDELAEAAGRATLLATAAASTPTAIDLPDIVKIRCNPAMSRSTIAGADRVRQ